MYVEWLILTFEDTVVQSLWNTYLYDACSLILTEPHYSTHPSNLGTIRYKKYEPLKSRTTYLMSFKPVSFRINPQWVSPASQAWEMTGTNFLGLLWESLGHCTVLSWPSHLTWGVSSPLQWLLGTWLTYCSQAPSLLPSLLFPSLSLALSLSHSPSLSLSPLPLGHFFPALQLTYNTCRPLTSSMITLCKLLPAHSL